MSTIPHPFLTPLDADARHELYCALHDAEVFGMDYRVAGDGERDVVLRVECNPDTGIARWTGCG